MTFPAGEGFQYVGPNLTIANEIAIEIEGRVQQLQQVGGDLEDLEAQVKRVLVRIHDSGNCLE